MIAITAESADEVWLEVARKLRSGKLALVQTSRAGDTRELLHTCVTIRDPRQRWVLSRRPAINPAFALVELVWIMTGRNDSAFVNSWNPALPRYAGNGCHYHGAYGFRLRRHFGFDQLARAYEVFSKNPDTRQVVLQLWDARADLPRPDDGSPTDPDIPCNVCSLLKVRDGKLEWLQVIRSNDIFLGVPYNFVQFTSLQEIIAGWLGLELGEYMQISDSLHVYERDLPSITSLRRASPTLNNDRFTQTRSESEKFFCTLAERIERMVGDLDQEMLEGLSLGNALPSSFQNILKIVAADAARRRQWDDLAARLASACTNDCLRAAWDAWKRRCAQKQPHRVQAINDSASVGLCA